MYFPNDWGTDLSTLDELKDSNALECWPEMGFNILLDGDETLFVNWFFRGFGEFSKT